MASVARARRTPQACDNCRRKKTRCPGEKPRCSTCARLRQECCYPRGEFQDGVQSPDIISRLSQLEEKLDLVLSRAPALADAPPPTADESQDTTVLPGDSPGWPEPAGSRLLPSRSLVSRGIDIYFLCSHRQPIWLFESPGDLSPDSREELILAVLAISVQYARDHLAGAGLLSPSVYSDAARSLIMLRIANASVDVATLQSLCLLSFSNLVSGQVQLASFHVGLVSSLMQCSGVDMHFTDERSPSLEQNRRLFWSVQAIRVLCGPPTKIPTTLDIEEPQFLSPDETSATITTGQAPLLPVEPRGSRNHLSLGIWAHLIRSASLWGLVRAYIWRCADGLAIAPWKSDSQYTAINSRLLEMECVFPTSYRYDAAKFSERSEEELNADRDFWLPWMKIQLTYHTLHSVLNHPFLYSSRESRPKQGPNAFWKTSTDQALLHSTWIARLINMASEKSFVLADPFFGYSASVAATLHLYWSRSADSRVQESAKGNLKICRALIAELGARWPICQTMAEDVDRLIQFTAPRNQGSMSTADHISLMWKILDFASVQQSLRSHTSQGLFHSSWASSLYPAAGDPEPMTLEDPQVESPPADYQTSMGSYAAPPDWLSSMAGGSSRRNNNQTRAETRVPAAPTGQAEFQPRPGREYMWDLSDASYDIWAQPNDRSVVDLRWPDYGNL